MNLLQNPKFDLIMSRDARSLRDEVLNLCLQHGAAGKPQAEFQEFADKVVEQYTPVVWERAILYADGRHIKDAIFRITSTAYHKHKDKPGKKKPNWERGTIKGSRLKGIDWLAVANADPEFWLENIQFPRHGAVLPNIFDKRHEEFCAMHTIFSHWLITDYSFKTLYFIYDLAGRFSVDFVQGCMDLVLDKSKRSAEYLSSIIDKENALRMEALKESKETLQHSKRVIEAIASLAHDRDKPVDWEDIENKSKSDIENAKVFNEIKYS